MTVIRSEVRSSCTKAGAYDVEAKTGGTLLETGKVRRGRDSSRMKLVTRGRRKSNRRTGLS